MEVSPFLEESFILTSWNGTRWEGPVQTADKEPQPDNTNGIYARSVSWTASPYSYTGIDTRPKMYGVVALSGRVIEGTSGYRAMRAVVRELWGWGGVGRELDLQGSLERRYMCPVHLGEVPPWEQWHWL